MPPHKAFTLPEVIASLIVITILASIVLFSITEATTTAQADNLINTFAQLRMAYSALYAERDDEINTYDLDTLRKTFQLTTLLDYIQNADNIPNIHECSLQITANGSWLITYPLTNKNTPRLKRKLAGYAQSSGLLGTNSLNILSSLTDYTEQDYVIVKLR